MMYPNPPAPVRSMTHAEPPVTTLLAMFACMALMICFRTPSTCAQSEPKALFPEFHELKPPVLIPPDPTLTVAPEGHFLLNGEPRYLLGQISYEAIHANFMLPTPGYPDSLKWLYETPPTYETAQRLGFDVMGVSATVHWMKSYIPSFTHRELQPEELAAHRNYVQQARLPLYVDCTGAVWSQGALWPHRDKLAPEMFNAGGIQGTGNHWVAYSVTHPKGRAAYEAMWREAVESVRKLGGKPFVYELFNEPAYNDPSPYNRQLFAQRLQAQFGSIDKLNQAWKANYQSFEEVSGFENFTQNIGLFVEWHKFMEDVFVDICKLGVQTIRATDPDPDVRMCVQPMRWRHVPQDNVNLYKLSKVLNAISTTTGGADMLEGHFYRSIARGKPIHDGETYMGRTFESYRDQLWTQMARGLNASFVFKWSRRAWDAEWKQHGAQAGTRLSERFHWLMLNPYGVPTRSLTGMMAAKEEMLKVGDLFFPRERGVQRDVAVMVSFPTQRLAFVTGQPQHDFVMAYAEALEYGHIPMDVILEEQLLENRQREYRVIVAAGVDAVYEGTGEKLLDFVHQGGTLVLGLEALQLNEYGQPTDFENTLGLRLGEPVNAEVTPMEFAGLNVKTKPYRRLTHDADWQTLARTGAHPAILERKHGQGRIIYFGAQMQREELRLVLRQLLDEQGIKPACNVLQYDSGEPAYGIEIHPAHREGLSGYLMFNRRGTPMMVRFAGESMSADAMMVNPLEGVIHEVRDGQILLTLQPGTRHVVISGPRETLAGRFGPLKEQSWNDALVQGQKTLEAHAAAQRARALKQQFSYPINLEQAMPLDLRNVANRHFYDTVPGDGKGGWTDQGANHLRGLEWGRHMMLGVPFEIIRWDHNQERACIVLASKNMRNVPEKVTGIQVQAQVKALYFLHASAWTSTGNAFQYVLNHADGSSTIIPIRGRVEIGDWYNPNRSDPDQVCRPAWINSEGRGLFAWRWENPQPHKAVTTIDIVSANGGIVPIIVAMTAERWSEDAAKTTPSSAAALPTAGRGAAIPILMDNAPKGWTISTHNTDAKSVIVEGVWRIALGPKSVNWCSARLEGKTPIALPVGMGKQGTLVFEVNGLEDEWGEHLGGHLTQVLLSGNHESFKRRFIPLRRFTPDEAIIDSDPQTWQTVRIPMRALVDAEESLEVTGFNLQFQVLPSKKAGIQIRRIRFEP